MNRRTIIKGAALLTGAPLVLAASKKKFRWRLVLAIPKTLPIWGDGVMRFADNVKAMSEGRLDIKVFGAGEMVPALESFDAVKAGRVQMAHAASYYWQGKMPAAPFFCAVPFGMNANGMRAWMAAGGGQKLWDELYGQHGVVAFPAGNTGLQMGGWFNKEINSIADFKGLKMRIPGLGGKVVEKAGGKPILVPGGEIFTNLSTGVIDATEWVGPYHDYTMGFHKAAKFYYYPGWHEPGPVLELMINKKAWDELPRDLQIMVETACAAMDRDIYSQWIGKDAEYLQKIKSETKVQIKAFPAPVLAQLKQYAREVKDEIAKADPLAKKIAESYKSFQELYEAHQAVTEWKYVESLKS